MPETLPEEMKGLQSIVDQAKDFDIAVYCELKKSQQCTRYARSSAL